MNNTTINTATSISNESMIPDRINQSRAPTHEKILFRERRSAYSDGSALFMIYESDVTSLNSLIIPYKHTEIKRSTILIPEFKKRLSNDPEVTTQPLE